MSTLDRSTAAFVVVMLVLLTGIVGYTLGSATSNTITVTTSVQSYPQFASLLFASHLLKIDLRNASKVSQDYSPSGVLVWEGNAQGLQGTYAGENISVFWCGFLCHVSTLSISNSSFQATTMDVTNRTFPVVVNATILISGHSTILGNFSGTISERIDYTETPGGRWLITNDTWNFLQLNETAGGYA